MGVPAAQLVHAELHDAAFAGVLANGCLYSATGNGRVGFIDAADIAAVAVAVAALTDPDVPTGEVILTGPDALAYDDVAAAITEASGRRVVHRRLAVDALAGRYQELGLPPSMLRRSQACLDEWLRDHGVTQVVVCGVATGTGVEMTARQAYDPGDDVALAGNAMTD